MSPRSRPRPPAAAPPPAAGDPDLDSTAELPVLDPAGASTSGAATTTSTARVAVEAADDQQATTDNWALSPAARAALHAAAASAEKRLDEQAELRARTAALQEAQERLASQAKRLLQLEHARDEALAAQAAAAQRGAAAEQRAVNAAERSAAFEQRVVELEQRTARLTAELAERQSGNAQAATRAEESARALAAAEKRAATAAEELAQARAMVSAAGARAQQFQQLLAQHDSAARARQVRELEQQQAQAAVGRAHAASVMEDLHSERARAMGYLESLQTLERRRELVQELVTDLQQEAEASAAHLARLTQELSGREERARVQEAELARRAARLGQLEQHGNTLTNMLAQRDAELREAQQETQGLRASVTRLQAEANAGSERLQALEAQAAEREQSGTQQQTELQRLRSDAAGLAAELQEARRSALNGAQLEASLGAERQRAGKLEGELATVRAEMQDWGSALRTAQQERDGQLASLATAQARIRELEGDLQVAEETLHRHEADARNRAPASAEPGKSAPQLPESAAEARHAATDTNPALGDSARHARDEPPAAEPVSDGATRLLIHSEDGREVVHVLGRKTSIGRTPDNDLQLEAKFVSRHHAVILVGPVNTVIEDLNSTNGVQVNGRRITRQTLRDGDQIAIGRMHYRFAVRKPADRR